MRLNHRIMQDLSNYKAVVDELKIHKSRTGTLANNWHWQIKISTSYQCHLENTSCSEKLTVLTANQNSLLKRLRIPLKIK